jgi:ethanolamine utilization protein EutN
MEMGRVIGSLTATQKDGQLEGLVLRLLQPVDADDCPVGEIVVATDSIGADEGQLVFYVTAYEAVIPLRKQPALTDATIIGIIDSMNIPSDGN